MDQNRPWILTDEGTDNLIRLRDDYLRKWRQDHLRQCRVPRCATCRKIRYTNERGFMTCQECSGFQCFATLRRPQAEVSK